MFASVIVCLKYFHRNNIIACRVFANIITAKLSHKFMVTKGTISSGPAKDLACILA
jgi:hypothetical protein